MKILIDNTPLEQKLPAPESFPEFCEQIMGVLLARNLSIGSCEFDGTVVGSLEEAHDLFSRCEICKIASIPLAVALEAALTHKCGDARRLEEECEGLVTEVLLGEPTEIVIRWQTICEEIKSQIGFLPRLSGLLSIASLRISARSCKRSTPPSTRPTPWRFPIRSNSGSCPGCGNCELSWKTVCNW
jgi:hypothetical protein